MPTSNSSDEAGRAAGPSASAGAGGPLQSLAVLLKWLGAAAVVAGVACFPMVIWFPGPWAVLSLLMVMAGCVLLVAGLRAQRALAPAEEMAGEGQEEGPGPG